MGKIDLGAAFNKGWEIFSKNMMPLIVGSFLVMLIGGLSVGLLYFVMMGGLYGMIRKAWNGETIEIGEVFAGFNNFGPLFLGGLLTFAVIFVGILACGIGAIPASGIIVFLCPLIVEGNSVGDAWNKCWAGFKANWVGYIVVALVTGILSQAGQIAFYLGVFFTMPFAYCVLYAAYKQEFDA